MPSRRPLPSDASVVTAPVAGLSVHRPRAIGAAVRSAFLLGAVAGAVMIAGPGRAEAQGAAATTAAQKHAYDIPAGSLDQVLNRFAGEASVELSVDSTLTQGKTSSGLSGSYTVDEGFDRLVRGQGLQAVRSANGAYSLRALPPAPQGGEATLPTVQVKAKAENATTEELGTYTASAVTVGKMPQALKDTPQAISIISSQQIEDQNLIGIEDALAQATGITTQRWYGDAVFIQSRGFEISNFRYDGGPASEQASRSYSFLSDTIAFDHIEVLRGADSLAVGAGDPAGSVNLVHKRPTAERQIKWSATTGSWNTLRSEIDVGGPLNASGSIRARGVAAVDNHDYFYDNANSHGQSLYGVVEADLTPTTLWTAGVEYEHVHARPWMGGGIPRYTDGSRLDVPRSTSYVYDWNRRVTDTWDAFTRLEQALAGDWKLTLNAHYRREDSTFLVGIPGFGGAIVDPGTGIAAAALNEWDDRDHFRQLGTDATVTGSVNWFGRTHQLLAGVDYAYYRMFLPEAHDQFGIADVDFLHFDPGSYPYPAMPRAPQNAWSPYLYGYTKLGAYTTGRFELLDGLHLIAGGRLNNIAGNVEDDRRKLTPYGGLTYALGAQHTAYISTSELYESQSDEVTQDGKKLDPMTGRNNELGIKGEYLNGRVNGYVALYRMERKNQGVALPGTNYPCCYVEIGKVVSEGVDVELAGAITRDWNFTAGYTYNYSVDKQTGQTLLYGNDLTAPKHLFKLWTTYHLPGVLADWKLGGGVTAQTKFISYDYEQPGFGTASAFVEYSINPKLSLALNVNNLFDHTYWQTEGWYGEPRSFMLTLRGKY